MSQVSVEEIITKGSAKKRALLILNHVTDKNEGKKTHLSESEYQSLLKSFKSDRDIKTYQKFQAMHATSYQILSTLSQYRAMHSMALERLDKYIIMKKNNEAMHLALSATFGTFIDGKVDETEFKEMILSKTNDISVLRHFKLEKRGIVDTTKDSLFKLIWEAREEVAQTQALLKATIEAIKDYYNENGFKMKVFSSFLKEVETWAKGKSGKGFTVAMAKDGPEDDLCGGEKDYADVEIDPRLYDRMRQTIAVTESQHRRAEQ